MLLGPAPAATKLGAYGVQGGGPSSTLQRVQYAEALAPTVNRADPEDSDLRAQESSRGPGEKRYGIESDGLS